MSILQYSNKCFIISRLYALKNITLKVIVVLIAVILKCIKRAWYSTLTNKEE